MWPVLPALAPASVLCRTNRAQVMVAAVRDLQYHWVFAAARGLKSGWCGAPIGLPAFRGNMRIRNAVMLLALATAANAAELSVASAMATAENRAALNVSLATRGDALTGIQFDIEYDATAVDVSVEAGPAATSAGKGVQSALVKPGKQRVIVFGLNQNGFSDGVVAILRVSLKDTAEAGLHGIHLSALVGTNRRAETVAISGQDGSVKAETRRTAK